jgi:transcriptional regulator with XRE-family HTH domain
MKQEIIRERGYDLGPTGQTVAANLRRLRGAVPLRSVENRLEKIGRRITASALQKIEAGKRRVDADELTALAFVLRTTPNNLLLPDTAEQGRMVEVTGIGEVDAANLWEWAHGRKPMYLLDGENPDEADDRFTRVTRPEATDRDLEDFVLAVRRAAEGGASLNVTDDTGANVASYPKGFDAGDLFGSDAFKRAVREALRDE